MNPGLAKNEMKMGPGSNISYAFLFEEEKRMKKWGQAPIYHEKMGPVPILFILLRIQNF